MAFAAYKKQKNVENTGKLAFLGLSLFLRSTNSKETNKSINLETYTT